MTQAFGGLTASWGSSSRCRYCGSRLEHRGNHEPPAVSMIDGTLLNAGKKEPLNLKKWPTPSGCGPLFSCARPGRGTSGRSEAQINDEILHRWVQNLPQASPLHIVSLLGKKADRPTANGPSEFVYYPFRSCEDASDSRPTFQEWLNRNGSTHIVHEFPTIDKLPLKPTNTAHAAIACVRGLLKRGLAVLVVDSGGVQRTGELCRRVLSN